MPWWVQWFIHYVLPDLRAGAASIGRTVGDVAMVGIAILLTRYLTNSSWRKRILHHLPALARQTVAEEKERADHFEREARRLDKELQEATAACRGAANITTIGLQRVKAAGEE